MRRLTWAQAGIWLALWVLIEMTLFATLPGRQGFWVETVIILATGVGTFALVEVIARRRPSRR